MEFIDVPHMLVYHLKGAEDRNLYLSWRVLAIFNEKIRLKDAKGGYFSLNNPVKVGDVVSSILSCTFI